jgi:hypothetical protein
MDRYGDRLEAATYEGDEPVGAGPAQDAGKYEGWIWIPGRLFARMQQIAEAYELHVLPGLGFYDRNVLGREQLESLLEEIEFIGNVVDDPAIHPQLEQLRNVALKVVRAPTRTELVIEGP